MSLNGLLLEKLARWRPDGRQTLTVNDVESGWTAEVEGDAVDLVGCRLWHLSVRRPGEQKPALELDARAKAIAARVSGLLEPLSVIETDSTRDTALLRSAPPSRRDDVVSYYELLLKADGGADLRRYEGPHSEVTRRRQVELTLTHESLRKLVADLTI